MIWGAPLGSLWASFSLLFVKILIFLKKVVPPILNDSTVFLLHFGGPGPPGRHQKVKKQVSEFSWNFAVKKKSAGAGFYDFRVPLGFPFGSRGHPKY